MRSWKKSKSTAKLAALDNLGTSSQCGCSVNLTGSPLTLADDRAKLKMAVDIANEVRRH